VPGVILINLQNGKTQEKIVKYLPLVIIIIGAIILAINFDISKLKGLLEKYEKFGIIICLFTYVILGLTVIPSEPVSILVLAWKGPAVAILLATIGNTLAAIVEFFIGGGIGDLANFEKKKEKLPFHLGKLPINSPAFLLLARMLPGFGPKFVSIVSGVYQVPMFTYLWTTIVANMLGAAVIVLGGSGLLELIR
jgi:uncharacterized membrane protein YdjX (TVP38/TMEM64 family)